MITKTYTHLLFDLDHTLWDFEANSIETLQELYHTYQLHPYFSDFYDFRDKYGKHNSYLWSQYRKGKINKSTLSNQRFIRTLNDAGHSNSAIGAEMAKGYINISPTKTKLIPHAIETLTHLKQTHQLHIITNGFKEVQTKKLEHGQLMPYFDKLFISDQIGAQKPNVYFFEYVVKSLNAKKQECLVIGDNLATDIGGAKKAGLDHVFFNPKQTPHDEQVMHEITCLSELK